MSAYRERAPTEPQGSIDTLRRDSSSFFARCDRTQPRRAIPVVPLFRAPGSLVRPRISFIFWAVVMTKLWAHAPLVTGSAYHHSKPSRSGTASSKPQEHPQQPQPQPRKATKHIPRQLALKDNCIPSTKNFGMLCHQTRKSVQEDAGPCWELNELMRDWYQVRKSDGCRSPPYRRC